MIGKRARLPKKPDVLFLLILMYHLNSIPLWSLAYQFTCNLQCECLIIVFIISTNTNKEPSIIPLPRRNSIFCSQIKNAFPVLGS